MQIVVWAVLREGEHAKPLTRREVFDMEHLFLTASRPSHILLPSLFQTWCEEEWTFDPETLSATPSNGLQSTFQSESSPKVFMVRYIGNLRAIPRNRFSIKDGEEELTLPTLRNDMLVAFLKNKHLPTLTFQFKSGNVKFVKHKSWDTYSHALFRKVGHEEWTRVEVVDRRSKWKMKVDRASRFVQGLLFSEEIDLTLSEELLMKEKAKVVSIPEMSPSYVERDIALRLGSVDQMYSLLLSCPDDLCCPISKLPLRFPVVCHDGNVYERDSILRWMEHSTKSPVTGDEMGGRMMVPCLFVRNAVRKWVEESVEQLE